MATITASVAQNETVTCDNCAGTGKVPFGGYLPPEEKVVDGYVNCETCRGTGEVEMHGAIMVFRATDREALLIELGNVIDFVAERYDTAVETVTITEPPAEAPVLIDEASQELRCPHCSAANKFAEQDSAVRINNGEVEFREDGVVVYIMGADIDYQTDFYLCLACTKRVTFPPEIEVTWG